MPGYTWFDRVSGEHRPIQGRATKVEMPVPDEFIVHRRSRTLRPDSKLATAHRLLRTGGIRLGAE